jgi:hypothetical protein
VQLEHVVGVGVGKEQAPGAMWGDLHIPNAGERWETQLDANRSAGVRGCSSCRWRARRRQWWCHRPHHDTPYL